MGSTDRTGGASPAPPPPGEDHDQGPADDDPTTGVIDEDDGVSVRDRDLIEPGLGDAELGVTEIVEPEDSGPGPSDETGTGGDDESQAAAEGLDEAEGFVEGSEPAEAPGATDDLFPADETGSLLGDAGEEGLDEEVVDALDDVVTTRDPGWQESGPQDEADGLVETSLAPAPDAAVEVSCPVGLVGPESLIVAGLAACAGRVVAIADRAPAEPPAGAAPLASVPAGPFVVLHPAAEVAPAGIPAGFGTEEEQRITALAWSGGSGDPGAARVVRAATDRGMVFHWFPGAAEWTVADEFLREDGRRSSWLPLGVSRSPFRLVRSCVHPGRVWAWRPGGPLLRADGDGPWVLEDAAGALRAFVEDPARGEVLAFLADEESAVLRVRDARGEGPQRELPPGPGETLLAPGLLAAATDGVVWLASRDPETPALRGEIDGGAWRDVPGLRAVRFLEALPGGGVVAVATRGSDEVDLLLRATDAGRVEILATAPRLGAMLPGRAAGASTDRFEGLAVGGAVDGPAFLLLAGRVFAAGPVGETGGGGGADG
jgi:hypothetical protein